MWSIQMRLDRFVREPGNKRLSSSTAWKLWHHFIGIGVLYPSMAVRIVSRLCQAKSQSLSVQCWINSKSLHQRCTGFCSLHNLIRFHPMWKWLPTWEYYAKWMCWIYCFLLCVGLAWGPARFLIAQIKDNKSKRQTKKTQTDILHTFFQTI